MKYGYSEVITPQIFSTDLWKKSGHYQNYIDNMFMMTVDEREFGAPRSAVLAALEAEGIPCSAGYGYSLPDQPLFQNKAFGPYLNNARARFNYNQSHCPNSDMICREQCIWLEQNLFLGDRADMDDIADAFQKIYEHREALNSVAAQ